MFWLRESLRPFCSSCRFHGTWLGTLSDWELSGFTASGCQASMRARDIFFDTEMHLIRGPTLVLRHGPDCVASSIINGGLLPSNWVTTVNTFTKTRVSEHTIVRPRVKRPPFSLYGSIMNVKCVFTPFVSQTKIKKKKWNLKKGVWAGIYVKFYMIQGQSKILSSCMNDINSRSTIFFVPRISRYCKLVISGHRWRIKFSK